MRIPEPDQVLYKNRNDAERAARARGCEGTHRHEVDGEPHYMPCETHGAYHDGGDASSGTSDPTNYPIVGGSDTDRDTGMGGGLFDGGLRPRDGAESVSFGRDRDSGEFDQMGGQPVGLERDPDSGQLGPDPYAIGNFGQFNSPYDTDEEEEDKYE